MWGVMQFVQYGFVQAAAAGEVRLELDGGRRVRRRADSFHAAARSRREAGRRGRSRARRVRAVLRLRLCLVRRGSATSTAAAMAVFWHTLFLFGYCLAGLWFGVGFLAIGLSLTALILLVYLFAGPVFWPLIALVTRLRLHPLRLLDAAGLMMNAPDEIIHQPVRLRVMAALTAPGCDAEGLDFTQLKRLTGATDGNLGAHLDHLARAGYVEATKAFVGGGRARPSKRRRWVARPSRATLPF